MSRERSSELLQMVREGARYGNIQLEDVERVLSDQQFTDNEGLLSTTENGKSTLLHLAAQTTCDTVLPLVCQAYKRSKLFPPAMAMLNSEGLNPLHVAIQTSRFENTVLLFKESMEQCPNILQPDDNEWTLLHSAALVPENINIVKYLLSQELCRPFIVCKGQSTRRQLPSLPADIARDTVIQAEFQLKTGQQQLERFSKQAKLSSFARDAHARTMVEPKKKVLEKARELCSEIERVTLEFKASLAEQRVKELEMAKVLEKQATLNQELEKLLQTSQWRSVEESYLLSDSEETRKMCVEFLVSKLESISLPELTASVLRTLTNFLQVPEEDPSLLLGLKLLEGYSRNQTNASTLLSNKDVLPTLTPLLSSRDTNLQTVVLTFLLNLTLTQEFVSSEDNGGLLDSLHLLRHYSTSGPARRLASQALVRLGSGQTPPDPGVWSTRQVALWMDSITELDRREQYIAEFLNADINGLHLLELSVGEMAGLGVKFVSHQRILADKIDELRRMNARSMVGRKDIFLSYAHINIDFARRIKNVLNKACYSVWIDEAGIRAGQKWRNEIADGIQGCGVFILLLSNRSANSQYCHNEVAMAETYGKPIVTVKVEELGEVDPGLTFVIGRRQWLDFSHKDSFQSRTLILLETVEGHIGPGRNTSSEEKETVSQDPDKPSQASVECALTSEVNLLDQLEKLRTAMETGLEGLINRVQSLETSLVTLSSRVDTLEK